MLLYQTIPKSLWRKEWIWWGFPGCSDDKRICPQCGRPRFDPWVSKIPWRREWLPTLVFLHGEFQGHRSLAGYSPWDLKELDMTERLTHTHTQWIWYHMIFTWDSDWQTFTIWNSVGHYGWRIGRWRLMHWPYKLLPEDDGSVVKNLPAKAGDAGDMDSIPGWRRSPGRGNGNPTPIFLHR